jgi:type I restriction enzyme, R subunit
MRDHGLFQAICRVNRLDTEDKEYGYVIDYKDLFKSLAGAIRDYTSEALDGFDKEDVDGLLKERLKKAKERLEETREAVRALCEPVLPPKDSVAYLHYFCSQPAGVEAQLKENESKRLTLYKSVAALVRAYANIAGEMTDAGYSETDAAAVKAEVDHFDNVRGEVKLASGDYIDLKKYEPAMRHLIDTYIRAEPSQEVSALDNMTLIDLVVERGEEFVQELPKEIWENEEAVAEVIENNVRKRIVEEQPVNPKYYNKMSELLDALVKQRRDEALSYREYLRKIVELTEKVSDPLAGGVYPSAMDTPGKRALFDNLDKDDKLVLAVDKAVRDSRQDEWRSNRFKTRKVELAIKEVLTGGPFARDRSDADERTKEVLQLVEQQREY